MKAKRIAGIVCIALGFVLILGSLGLYCYNKWDSAQAGKAADNTLVELEKLIESGAPTKLVTPEPLPTQEPGATEETGETVPEETEPVPELTSVTVDGHEYVGYLSIPSLNRKLPVMKIAYLEDLQLAPCLQFGSPFTNDAVIAAHNYDSHFGPLRNFKGGEEIQFTDMNGVNIRYTVKTVESIEPTAVSKVKDSDYDLVLYTCTTGGQARVMIGCSRS